MKLVVFVGPTIDVAEVRGHVDAEVLPPASQGDVHRAAIGAATAIGIIDGYFDRVPAVWHKEILRAMASGVRVYGSASMGALRAAELAAFGMVGVGAIFESFRSGALEDDDEVAVAHASADLGYRAVSEAMVNLRATLARAVTDRIVPVSTAEALISAAKGMFYAERSLAALVAWGLEHGIPRSELDHLRGWWGSARVNQKALDAVAMLDRMQSDAGAGHPLPRASFSFEHTVAWEAVTRSGDGKVPSAARAERGASPSKEPAPTMEQRLEEELILFAPRALLRALEKQARFDEPADRGTSDPAPTPDESARALAWYFGERLGRTVPEDVDAYAREVGLGGADKLHRALWRELRYVASRR